MSQFETVTEFKNGKIKILLSPLKMFYILRNNLEFCYVKYNNKGYYLRNVEGRYIVVQFCDLVDAFIEFVKTKYETSTPKEELLETIYRQAPIKNGVMAKEVLKIDYLSDERMKEIVSVIYYE